jgi:hypothetical protein
MELTNPYEKQQHLDRMEKTYFEKQSKRNILPLTDEQNEILQSNNGHPDQILFEVLYRDLRIELEDEFIRYCEDRIHTFEIASIDDFISKSIEDLTTLFNSIDDRSGLGDDDDDFDALFDPDTDASTSNDDGTGKATKKHYGELYQLLSDAAIGRFNERFYYFYAYLTNWVDPNKAPYLDQDFLYCIDVSRLKEIANDSLLQAKLRYIIETYLESTTSTNNYTCRLDLTNTDLQIRMLRALQKSLTVNLHDFSSLDEARTILIKDILIYYYAGFKAYLHRINLSKKHPARMARLQEKFNIQQKQQRPIKPDQTNKSITPQKLGTISPKQNQSESSPPIDITTITKTQRLLNERIKEFETIEANKINDVVFPDINKPKQQGSATNNKSRSTNSQDERKPSTERLNSDKEKHRGPVTVQYTLTSGLKVKYSDGRPAVEGPNSGPGVQEKL